MAHRYLGLMIEDSYPLNPDSQYCHFNEQESIPQDISQSIQTLEDNKTTESINDASKKVKKAPLTQKNAHLRQLATKRIVKMFPGETKNLPKNLCRAMKGFIESLFTQQQIQKNQALRQFMNKSKQKCGKEDIDHFLSSEIGRKVGDMFFGDLKFTAFFVKENKVDLDSYFRILDEYFLPNGVQEQ